MKLNLCRATLRTISIVVVSFVTLSVTSCNYGAKKREQARQQEIADSLEAVAIAEAARIEKARIDSLALCAWGDLKFGMSPKEVKATASFKNSDKYVKGTIMHDGRRSRSSISLSYEATRQFEDNMNLNLSLWDFDACFRSDELTSILIKSYDYSASYINDIERDASIWARNFTAKCGSPTYQKSDVSILDFERGREFTYARWEIGDKTITISMGEDSYDSEFYYDVYIYHSGFPTKEDVEEQESIRKYQEKKKAETANYF